MVASASARGVNLVAERRKRGKPSTTITKGNSSRCNHFDITSSKHLLRCFIHGTWKRSKPKKWNIQQYTRKTVENTKRLLKSHVVFNIRKIQISSFIILMQYCNAALLDFVHNRVLCIIHILCIDPNTLRKKDQLEKSTWKCQLSE